ncbi:MAG: hypothetical protein ACI8TQ_003838 [Planctomycetota bacterium]|jgi:hypothetical protein
MNRLSIAAALLILTSPVFAQQVLVVDESGARGDFTDIQPAVDAAVDGDLILVKTGTYGPISIDGKSISISADSGALPVLEAGIAIQNIASNQSVLVQGLRVASSSAFDLLSIDNCPGAILLQECQFGTGTETAIFAQGVSIFACEAVTMVGVEVDVRDVSSGFITPVAVSAASSSIYLYDCDLESGTGESGIAAFGGIPAMPGATGPAALILTGTTALVSGCRFTGGKGGFAGTPNQFSRCTNAGDGGPAIQMREGFSELSLHLVDSTLIPGQGGVASNGCVDGQMGDTEVEVQAGTFVDSATFARSYTVTPVVRVGETKVNLFLGQPGDFIWQMFSVNQLASVFSPAVLGAIYPGSPFFFKYRGKLDATGMKTRTVTLVPFGLPFVPLYEQVLYYNATEEFTVSNPQNVTLLGPGV